MSGGLCETFVGVVSPLPTALTSFWVFKEFFVLLRRYSF